MDRAPSTVVPSTAVPSVVPRTAAVRSRPERLPGLLVMLLRLAKQHVLVVIGEADLATAGQLRGHLTRALAEQPPSLLVDLSALDFCDLLGLDALRDATRHAEAVNVSMSFRGMSPQLAWLHASYPLAGQPRPADQTRVRSFGTDSHMPAGQPPAPHPAPPLAPATVRHRSSAARFGPIYAAVQPRSSGLRVHAVPATDTTRSALCGSPVRRALSAWDGRHPAACPDCTEVLAEQE